MTGRYERVPTNLAAPLPPFVTIEPAGMGVELRACRRGQDPLFIGPSIRLGEDEEEHAQPVPPVFLTYLSTDKLLREKADAEGIYDRVVELRQQEKDHADRFDHLLAEYRQTRRNKRRLRVQSQHNVANQVVWVAAEYGCATIVFESLGQIAAADPAGGPAWSISSWRVANSLT